MAQYLIQSAGAYTIIPLLKTMMIPSDHATEVAPDVGISGVNAFINSISTSFTYEVKTDPVIGSDGSASWTDVVSYASGMYLSLPQESHESVWHMGFVPAGAYFSVGYAQFNNFPVAAATRGMDIRSHYYGPCQLSESLGSVTNFNACKLTYVGELALPRIGAGQSITYQPPIPENYSKVRAFASDFKISSTTISGINFNLNGNFHSGVIADTRYISQIQVDTNAPRRAYPASALNQQSMTRPDDLKNVSVAKGAIDIMGPDYPRRWCSVDMDATDTLESEWKTYSYGVPVNPLVPASSTNSTYAFGPYHVTQLWVTPTDTEFFISNKTTLGAGQAPNPWARIYYGAINEDGILDIDVSVRASIAGTSANMTTPVAWDYVVNFVHVFAYIDAGGLVRYNLFSENQTRPYTAMHSYNALSMSNNGFAGPSVINATSQVPLQAPQFFKSRPRMLRTGFANTTGGKYLGTLCQLSLQPNTADSLGATYTINVYPGSVRVRARNVDAPGRVGPAHIIRYDTLGVGQQMSWAGTQWIQGIALGNLAPFIQSNGQTLTVPDNIFSKFAELLWALSPLYRRICSLEEYDKIIKPYFRDLNINDLVGSIEKLDDASAHALRTLGSSGGFIPQLAQAGIMGGMGGAAQKMGEILGARIGECMSNRAVGGAAGQYPVVSDMRGGSYLELGSSSGSMRRRGREY